MDALAEAEGFEYVLSLHEGTVIGMADGYAQATRRPSFVNLHTAPGLGNAMGVLANVAATGTPMVVTAGQQHRGHLLAEPFLSGDLVGLAEGSRSGPSRCTSFETSGRSCGGRSTTRPTPDRSGVRVDPHGRARGGGGRGATAPSGIDPRTVPANLAEAARLIDEVDKDRFAIVAGDEVAWSGAVPALVAVAERRAARCSACPCTRTRCSPPPTRRGPGSSGNDGGGDATSSPLRSARSSGPGGSPLPWYNEVPPLPPSLR